MNLSDAKATYAAHLAGVRKVSAHELNEACALIERDPGGVAFLGSVREEFGLDPSRELSLCEAFRHRAAEFSELKKSECESEFPLLVKHLAECPDCRRVLWQLKPLWKSVQEVARDMFRLVAPIRVKLLRGRALEEIGWDSLPSVESGPLRFPAGGLLAGIHHGPFSQAGKLLSADSGAAVQPPQGESRKEWRLPDESGAWEVHLVVESAANGGASLTCSLEPRNGHDAPESKSTRIELRYAPPRNSIFLAGRLADFQSNPIVVPPGSWLVRVIPDPESHLRGMEIPLDLTGAG